MRRILVAVALLVGAASAQATEIKVIDGAAKFPEGPFVENGILYYAQYGAGEIDKWDGQTRSVVWSKAGSGANAVQRFGDGFIIAGYDDGTIVLTDAAGKTRRVIDHDTEGNPLVGPNDIALDGKGGAYVSLSGPWEPGPIVGKIVHVTADGTATVMAKDIHYANGLVLSKDGGTLYVNESEANRVIQFAVAPDGALSDRRLFLRLYELGEPPSAYPDGIKLGPDGNLYIGEYSAGRILIVDPVTKKLVKTIDVPSAGAPNVAFSADGKTMYVTAVDDKSGAPYPGKVYAVTGF
ncbi:SMP-30/gluconolactonase/LRE family protein [Lichenifustis flavocetrariae]|uniref:SMP-30/gluconolactonase/LRE family protein n=1 Tax=Lichenifustis flavocetrariae TaxID=2949735 RepID=A0AA41YSK0_9HYPH|nr:SMP-30/gluconolactonase/LRE family protein [Lichenifustis flavocetrariae]MCW6507799.1 SMP-30/gluconolactonase/LRE family protein [Lichenifustis flavocetrariae]